MKKNKKPPFTDINAVFPDRTPGVASVLKMIFERKEFISEFQQELRHTLLIDVVQYWRDYERPNYRVTFWQHINEMIKHSIFPNTFADGKPFETGAFKYLRWDATFKSINAQSDWSGEMKQDVVDCYQEFAKWLSYISFVDFHPDEIFRRNELFQESKIPTFQDWRNFIEALGSVNKKLSDPY